VAGGAVSLFACVGRCGACRALHDVLMHARAGMQLRLQSTRLNGLYLSHEVHPGCSMFLGMSQASMASMTVLSACQARDEAPGPD